jgi:hypothetical protein
VCLFVCRGKEHSAKNIREDMLPVYVQKLVCHVRLFETVEELAQERSKTAICDLLTPPRGLNHQL